MMHFDNINGSSHEYLTTIISIIRRGIQKKKHRLSLFKGKREGLHTQVLVDAFNILGTTPMLDTQKWIWIGVQKENEQEEDIFREDIYFYLNDDALTRIFFVEAKRLPKPPTKDKEEYVVGDNPNTISGGIQRYKLERHGQRSLQHSGMIAYVENGSIDEWLHKINEKILTEYPDDSILISEGLENEYMSHHKYINSDDAFFMHHFWIDLVAVEIEL